jgi:hypothetical protein
MRIASPQPLLTICVLSILVLPFAGTAWAQPGGDHVVERVIHHQKAVVERVLQDLHPTLAGRLPAISGFADPQDQPWERFARGYFECVVELVPKSQGETLIRVTSKITAWYTDPNPAKSEYRELASNGRVESDLLDRIEDALAQTTQAQSVGQSSPASSPAPGTNNIGRIGPSAVNRAPYIDRASIPGRSPNSAYPGAGESPIASAIGNQVHIEDIESLRRRREAAEKQLGEANEDVKNLEEIQRNQTHPTDIAVVRKSGTRVMTRPGPNGPPLFLADAEDEFQILDAEPEWVHIQISGASRGWIRRSELTMPDELEGISRKYAPAAANDAPFRVFREQTGAFKGNWNSLIGKDVRIIWAEPAPQATKPLSGAAKRIFAKTILANAYKDISLHDSAVSGVVIVFDSADGGQIAATIESLKQWQAGTLSENSFWRSCSVDPPDFLSP